MKNLILTFSLIFASLALSHERGDLAGHVETSRDSAITEKFAIYYRFDDTRFDQNYLSNSETAVHIRNYLANSPRIDSIAIYAWAASSFK